MICSGFGHSEVVYHPKDLQTVADIMRLLITTQGVDTFWSGGRGGFDRIFSQAAASLKTEFPHIENLLVLSYRPDPRRGKAVFPQRYDGSVYLLEEACHYKSAISRTNRIMAERSSFVIAGVAFEYGGAYAACKHAKRLGVPVINIFGDISDAFPPPDFVKEALDRL